MTSFVNNMIFFRLIFDLEKWLWKSKLCCFWPVILKRPKGKNHFMAVFIVLWSYLSTTKLRCLQKNIGHTNATLRHYGAHYMEKLSLVIWNLSCHFRKLDQLSLSPSISNNATMWILRTWNNLCWCPIPQNKWSEPGSNTQLCSFQSKCLYFLKVS